MKVEATYWDNKTIVQPRRKTRVRGTKRHTQAMPQWFVFAVIAILTFMICLTVNLRAYTEVSAEIQQHQQLTNEIDSINSQNVLLQQQVSNLKNDSDTIEREARKIGMGRPDEKIIVPTN